eukprot:Nitzschia sp. Nitz4//scaffold108_size72880//53270//54277//NITZ4_005824-RA/size72880-processed-gene-0.41-mRNA-1//1//CDS//3329532696//2449//frame0
MGFLGKLKRRIQWARERHFLNQDGKDALTVMETMDDDPLSYGDTTMDQPQGLGALLLSPTRCFSKAHTFFDDEHDAIDHLIKMHTSHGAACSTYIPDGRGGDGVFRSAIVGQRDQECPTLTVDSDGEGDDDDGVGLLSRSGPRSYSWEKYENDEDIFEPSFEIALMDPDLYAIGTLPDSPPISPPTSPLPDNYKSNPTTNMNSNNNKKNDIFSFVVPVCTPLRLLAHQPQTRYDQKGQPFVHIYNEGLTTLYEAEETDDIILPCSPLANDDSHHTTNSSLQNWGSVESEDDVHMHARWALAREQLSQEYECEYEYSESEDDDDNDEDDIADYDTR